MKPVAPLFDLVVIGAGINGAGIARDAAGRGLTVLLVERGDIAGATSSWSTKLVHGGLRYLEHFEFRLVAESLREREVLLANAPHLVRPLSFVLPHEPHLRPAWMIRAGLFLYDRLGRRERLPESFAVDLAGSEWGAGLKSGFRTGFVYADAQVDDARLVVANVLAASELGARIAVRTRFIAAKRVRGRWAVGLKRIDGIDVEVGALAIVNAAGPWVQDVRDRVEGADPRDRVRHVKGSHIVVPRVHEGAHAFLLQNADGRIAFVIPYRDRYSLIGTTDVPVTEFEHPMASDAEIDYLLALVGAYLERPPTRADIVWSYAGVRPLHDDGSTDPSSITRDYVLRKDAGAKPGEAPALSLYGGKLTTYRRVAETALEELRPHLPAMRGSWTERVPLPGGDLPRGGIAALCSDLERRRPTLPTQLLHGLASRHGTRASRVLRDALDIADLGEDFGQGLYAAEVDYLIREEWARSAEDVLWRRTKCGLGMSDRGVARVNEYVAQRVAASGVYSKDAAAIAVAVR